RHGRRLKICLIWQLSLVGAGICCKHHGAHSVISLGMPKGCVISALCPLGLLSSLTPLYIGMMLSGSSKSGGANLFSRGLWSPRMPSWLLMLGQMPLSCLITGGVS